MNHNTARSWPFTMRSVRVVDCWRPRHPSCISFVFFFCLFSLISHRMQLDDVRAIQLIDELPGQRKVGLSRRRRHRTVCSQSVRFLSDRCCWSCRRLIHLRLTGSIPTEIGVLTALNMLCVQLLDVPPRRSPFGASHIPSRHLYDNDLTGSIPSTCGQLTALTELFVTSSTSENPHPPSVLS